MITRSCFAFLTFALVALVGSNPDAVAQSGTSRKLPPDAQAMLATFPDQQISLDLVIARAIQASDSFRAVRSGAIDLEAAEKQAQAILDFQIEANAVRTLSENEPQNPFNPTQLFTTKFDFGIAKAFQTGTRLFLGLEHGNTDLTIPFSPTPIPPFFETAFSVRLSQNLLQNSFGYGTRRLLRAGELQSEAARYQLDQNIQNWTLELMQVFYGAWLAQAEAKNAEENLARRQRLSRVTGVRLNRGTAEQPDRLQVESALGAARVRLNQAEETLNNRWRSLVISLKLPEEWLKIDPLAIPITLDQPNEAILAQCSSDDRGAASPERTSASQALRIQAEAAAQIAEQRIDAVKPTLDLEVGLRSNGIDQASRLDTFEETATIDHPAWTLALRFRMPLAQHGERAAAMTAVAQRERVEALAAQEQAFVKLGWMNACSELVESKRSLDLMTDVVANQRKREKLEEQRFGIGRSTTFQIIQAGDDAASAESNLYGAQVRYRLAGWRAQRLADGFKDYLQALNERKDLHP